MDQQEQAEIERKPREIDTRNAPASGRLAEGDSNAAAEVPDPSQARVVLGARERPTVSRGSTLNGGDILNERLTPCQIDSRWSKDTPGLPEVFSVDAELQKPKAPARRSAAEL